MNSTSRYAALLIATLFSVATAAAADWPNFRGPGFDGISTETGLLTEWPEKGPTLLWRVPLGEGFSAVSVASGRLFTMFDIGDEEHLVALDPKDGAIVWKLKTDAKWRDSQGNGPRSTPTVDGDRVYAVSSLGKLYAVAADSGKIAWSHDLAKDHGKSVVPQWGVSTSALVDGDTVYVNAGGEKDHAVIAFAKKDGAIRWHHGDDGPGYSTPVAITVAGKSQVVFFTAGSLLALNPKDGAELWRIPWKTDWNVNAATPVFVPPSRLFVSSGYSTGSALLNLAVDDKGVFTVSDVWRSKVLKNQFSSSIIVKGHIYGFDNRSFKAVNLHTGEEQWVKSELGHGSLTYADGKLYVLSEQGRLTLVDASPAAYKEHGAVQSFEGRCWTVPTLSGGRLYVRNDKELLCYSISG